MTVEPAGSPAIFKLLIKKSLKERNVPPTIALAMPQTPVAICNHTNFELMGNIILERICFLERGCTTAVSAKKPSPPCLLDTFLFNLIGVRTLKA
mmetsp:Transcript_14585/g.19438  ORF Transcript_14585/g.19438 Transcript_14585/m.19438 type:complete len:95 (-) Transcript_14585:64-348(-)